MYAHPPHTHTKKKNCQIRILCQFIEKYPALKNGYFVKKNHLPPLPHSPRPHTPPPTPRLIFLLIWIICQFDFVSVIFLQIDKESNFFFFLGGGGGGAGGVCGGVCVNIMNICLKWHFCSSRNTNVPNYSEIHAQIQKKWSRQAQFMTILSFDLQVCPSPLTFPNKWFKWHYYSLFK